MDAEESLTSVGTWSKLQQPDEGHGGVASLEFWGHKVEVGRRGNGERTTVSARVSQAGWCLAIRAGPKSGAETRRRCPRRAFVWLSLAAGTPPTWICRFRGIPARPGISGLVSITGKRGRSARTGTPPTPTTPPPSLPLPSRLMLSYPHSCETVPSPRVMGCFPC